NSVDLYPASLENLAVECTVTDQTLDGTSTFRRDHSLISIPKHFRVRSTIRKTAQGAATTTRTEWTLLRPDGYYKITDKGEGQFLLHSRQRHVTSLLLVDEAGSPIGTLLGPVCRRDTPLGQLLQGRIRGH